MSNAIEMLGELNPFAIERVWDYGIILHEPETYHMQVWFREQGRQISCIDMREMQDVLCARHHPTIQAFYRTGGNSKPVLDLESSVAGQGAAQPAVEGRAEYGLPIVVDGCFVRYDKALEGRIPNGDDFRDLFAIAAQGAYRHGEEQELAAGSVTFVTKRGEIVDVRVSGDKRKAEA